jgi:hypothetical protein
MLWILYQDSDEYILAVVCGTVGIFETVVKLTTVEVKSYCVQGELFINELASKIRSNPFIYTDRSIKNLKEFSE